MNAPITLSHLLVLACLSASTLLLTQCLPKERTKEENLSSIFGPSPLTKTQHAGEVDKLTLGQMGQDNALPDSIGTDPSNFDYDQIFGNVPGTGPNENRWLADHQKAVTLSRSQFKPLIIWFSHPKAESDRLFKTDVLEHEEVLRAIQGRVIRVKLDFSNTKLASGRHYRSLKAHYGARGFPYLAVMLPDGSKINEFKGYREVYREGYVQNLARSINEAEEQITQRQERLAKEEGYRWWQGVTGRVFAKPLKYDQKSERIALRGMWGEQWIVSVFSLQEKDQIYLARWITEQKNPEKNKAQEQI